MQILTAKTIGSITVKELNHIKILVIKLSNVKRYNENLCQNANHNLHALSPIIKHFTEENAKILSIVFINLIECL